MGTPIIDQHFDIERQKLDWSCPICGHDPEDCHCGEAREFKSPRKGSGYLVTTQKGLHGRTYHDKGLINHKVPVYLEGSPAPMLCRPDTLTINGFID